MIKRILTLLFVIVLSNFITVLYAQNKIADTLQGKGLDEVVITATKTIRKIKDVPAPVTVIKGSEIQKMGSTRLSDVLAELTGMQLVQNTVGYPGIQMQGLSSEYVLILIDGEPVIGRIFNVIDLRRITVNNIDRIEIIKGPSSSLFGSEALGGVINIITKNGKTEKVHGTARGVYQKYDVFDLSVDAGEQKKKVGWYVYAGRQSGNGYYTKENKDSISKSVPPYAAYTVNGKISYQLNEKQKLAFSGKFYNENMSDQVLVQDVNGVNRLATQSQQHQDYSFTPSYSYDISDRQKLQIHNYTTVFNNDLTIRYQDNHALFSESNFRQFLNRTELQYDWRVGTAHMLTVGAGDAIATVRATNYVDGNIFNQLFVYGQDQFPLLKNVHVIAGFRFDHHNQYKDRFSPKLAVEWKLNRQLTVYGNIASGYKAPAFDQLLLNFTNPVVGYTVLGANVAEEKLKEMQAQGLIQAVLIEPGDHVLKAESSFSLNAGAKYNPLPGAYFSLNVFYNNINNLIDLEPIAIKTNGNNVYTYFNHNKVFTGGVEFQADYTIVPGLQVSAGYQYLQAKDRDVLDQIKKGLIYYRDPETQTDHKVTTAMYGGLYNRSKHSGNIKIEYSNLPNHFDVSLRCIYRGRYGSGMDVNGDLILDDDREYVPGYALLNLTIRKKINSFTLEAGCNNLTGVINKFDASVIPYNWFLGATFRF